MCPIDFFPYTVSDNARLCCTDARVLLYHKPIDRFHWRFYSHPQLIYIRASAAVLHSTKGRLATSIDLINTSALRRIAVR